MLLLAAAVLVGPAVVAPAVAGVPVQASAPEECDGMGPGEEVGTVADPAVVELSGIVASRAHPGVLWVHNDSGGAPAVYALLVDR